MSLLATLKPCAKVVTFAQKDLRKSRIS